MSTPSDTLEAGLKLSDWLTVLAALLGPILAVQAQKWIERSQAKNRIKEGVFRALMATRGTRLASDHVQALNMINIAFYGSRVFGIRRQTAGEKNVTKTWRAYLDSLATDNSNYSNDQNERLGETRNDKFLAMLAAIAIEQNFDFDEVELKASAYSPTHHVQVEADGDAIRRGMAKVMSGEAAIPMRVVNLPSLPPQPGPPEAPPSPPAD